MIRDEDWLVRNQVGCKSQHSSKETVKSNTVKKNGSAKKKMQALDEDMFRCPECQIEERKRFSNEERHRQGWAQSSLKAF